MIGTWPLVRASRSRIAAVAPNPSISGICTSIRTTSNAVRSTAATAATHADPSAHHPRQLSGDRQPQPGATVLARGRAVGLRERFEDPVLEVLGDPDTGVADVE